MVETIKFDQAFDQDIRNKSIKVHGIAKAVRQAGFPIRTAATNLKTDSTKQVRHQFALKSDNTFSMIEFMDRGDDENQKIVDWLLSSKLPLKVINHGSYKFPTSTVFRIIIDYTGQ